MRDEELQLWRAMMKDYPDLVTLAAAYNTPHVWQHGEFIGLRNKQSREWDWYLKNDAGVYVKFSSTPQRGAGMTKITLFPQCQCHCYKCQRGYHCRRVKTGCIPSAKEGK